MSSGVGLPSVYIVTWPGLIKIGHASSKNRWQYFANRGAEVLEVWHYTDDVTAHDHEWAADAYARGMTSGGIEKHEAPWARHDHRGRLQAGGYMEVLRTSSSQQVAEQVALLLSVRGGTACRNTKACGATYSNCVTPQTYQQWIDDWRAERREQVMGRALRPTY